MKPRLAPDRAGHVKLPMRYADWFNSKSTLSNRVWAKAIYKNISSDASK